MSFQSSQNEIIKLFPTPTLLSSKLPIAKPLPGATPASTATLREVLQDSHKRWHCYFNDEGFHNHTAHAALALWSLGGDSEIIKAAYAGQCKYQRPAFASPGPINKANWTDHVGDPKYYDAYLGFFAAELADKGPAAVLEEYIFSAEANFPTGGEGKKVEMLNRFSDALIHPLIHTGFGVEFGLPGLIVQGLAQTAVHPGLSSTVIPAAWFQGPVQAKANSTPSALNILARVLADPNITAETITHDLKLYGSTINRDGKKILEHVETWSPDLRTVEGLKKALEEVALLVVIAYAVPALTSKENGLFNADFFHMHFVTSSMFLPSLLEHLKPKSRDLLLRSHLAVCLVWFVGRGKPTLDLDAFFQYDASLVSLTSTEPQQGPTHPLPAASKISPNPWMEVIQKALVHRDDHLPKLQRTLAHYAQLYGGREAGYLKDCELKGAEKIDGTLFVRAANLTAYRMNREFEGVFAWDRRGFYQEN